MSALSQDQAALLWRPPLYFDLARINLDSTTPAMMAPAITGIVVRSMFIDYPSSRLQLTNIVSFPCEHFSVAQDTLSGPRFPGGTFGFDHLVDGAAVARDSEVGHGRKHPFGCAISISQ
jgi:hypothetical protein